MALSIRNYINCYVRCSIFFSVIPFSLILFEYSSHRIQRGFYHQSNPTEKNNAENVKLVIDMEFCFSSV